MNRRAFLTGVAAAPAIAAAQSRVAAATGSEQGYTSLFDGHSLAGWSVQEGPESAFYVSDGAIVVHEASGYPAWLRSEKQYENFDFRCEFFVEGWCNSGIYLHAPEHGNNIETGIKINIFQDHDEPPRAESMGSIFPLVAPKLINVKSHREWNSMRIVMDWPRLRVWTNDALVQDADLETIPELRLRIRRGYLGLESLSYPIRFRGLQIRELPAKQSWTELYVSPADLDRNWSVSGGPKARFEALGEVLHAGGLGYLVTREKYRDFALQTYVRHAWHHNSGILFRTDGRGSAARHYEIQLHDVEGAHYPTGSLYHYKRSVYPPIEPGKWFLVQMWVQGKHCLVRINGQNVMEYSNMTNVDEGHIELQAHDAERWTQFKQMRIQRL